MGSVTSNTAFLEVISYTHRSPPEPVLHSLNVVVNLLGSVSPTQVPAQVTGPVTVIWASAPGVQVGVTGARPSRVRLFPNAGFVIVTSPWSSTLIMSPCV